MVEATRKGFDMSIDRLIERFEEKSELLDKLTERLASEKVVEWNLDEPTPEEEQIDRLIQDRLDDSDIEEG